MALRNPALNGGAGMFKVAGKRILILIPVLLVVLFLVMLLVDLQGGNIAQSVAGELATPELVKQTRERLHLDDPLVVRYIEYVGSALHGDLGDSWITGRPVWRTLISALPVTVSLAIAGLLFALLIGIPMGVFSALRNGRLLDRGVALTSSIFIAVPEFVSGLILVVVVVLKWNLLPATGYIPFAENPLQWAEHLILPGIALGIGLSGHLARQVRAAMMDALDQDFVRTARAMGLRERVVVGKHAARTAASPILTVIGLQTAHLLGGAVIVERVFALPGYGSAAVDGVLRRDIPVVQGAVLVTAVLVLLVNLIVDISYGYLNPKLRS